MARVNLLLMLPVLLCCRQNCCDPTVCFAGCHLSHGAGEDAVGCVITRTVQGHGRLHTQCTQVRGVQSLLQGPHTILGEPTAACCVFGCHSSQLCKDAFQRPAQSSEAIESLPLCLVPSELCIWVRLQGLFTFAGVSIPVIIRPLCMDTKCACSCAPSLSSA